MTEADFAREWTAFGGASLALMGAALAFGARARADDHLAWQRQWSRAVGAPEPAADRGALEFRYRLAGIAGFLVGAGLTAAAVLGRPLGSRVGPADARIMGACLTVLGAGFALVKLGRGGRRAPRFLDSDPLAAAPSRGAGEAAAEACVWLLCALWTGFGFRLFWEATR